MGIVYLIGYMGAGKTYWGKKFAKEMCLHFVDMDEYIEQKYNKNISEIFSTVGENEFRKIEHDALVEISEKSGGIVATGGGVPCFFDNMDIMQRTGITIYLRRTTQQLYDEIVQQKSKRPLLANLSEQELTKKIEAMLLLREPYYSKAHYIIDDYDPRHKIKDIINNKEIR